jgi:acetyl esterase/lipase
MLIREIQLWENEEDINLVTYILENSKEFQTDKKRPAIVICPGGGYLGTSDREAEPIALRFASYGYHAFVLRYNTGFKNMKIDFEKLPKQNEKSIYPGPLFDLAKAMMIIRENAKEWFVDSDRISICGFSAGAHLTASIGVHWQDDFLKEKFKVDSNIFKPNAIILGYPMTDYNIMKEKLDENPIESLKEFWAVSNKAIFGKAEPSKEEREKLSPTNYVTKNTPPTFLWHTADDGMVYVENSLAFAKQLSKYKVPYELHIFESGPHGLALCDESTAMEDQHINPHSGVWVDLVIDWLKNH